MNIICPSLFILIIHFLSLLSSVLSNSEDRVALLAIKSQITHDPHGVLNSWNDSLSICDWQGITCDTSHPHRVVGLNLEHNDLVGTLSPYVGNLSFLYNISLANNTLGGYIPPQIGNLLSLRYLALENNNFQGQIPANISQCLKLRSLGLGGNRLTGMVPSQLSLLSKLEYLYLYKNQLMGDLLSTVVMNLTSLRQLSASFNSFEGSIPHNIGAILKKLTFLSIGENKMSGTIPPSFYNLSNLQVLDLSLNQLHGTLPLDIGFRLPQLTIFHIGNNSFHGNLPASLSNLTHLVDLSVYSNNFTGKFMFSAKNMPNLESFDVSSNYLGTGEVGDLSFLQTLVNCTQLYFLQLSSNNFGGILPDFLGNLSSDLTELDFGLNKIYGTIPMGLYNLVNLERLSLQGNRLTGHLSPLIGKKLTKLQALNCMNNNLHGPVPYSLGNLSRLSWLYMGYNNFEGIIPLSLGNCTNLLYVSLNQNNLTGPLPPHLFHASMIVELNLHQNRLQGGIPVEIAQLTNLVAFDVSENELSGELPSSLGSCISLVGLFMGGNDFTGPIPQSFKSLTSLNYLQLSHNRLSGLIPNFLANLSLMTLDLSYNEFEGEVPRLGIFTNSSAIIVEGNSKLCGGISELRLPRCPKRESNRRGRLSVAVIVIIALASLIVGVSIVVSVYFLLRTKRKSNKLSHTSLFNTEHFSRVSYAMLLQATDNFSEENLLGTGHFGSVYKGVLDIEGNTVVAIKVINLEIEAATKSFMAECETLRNIRHRNLLKIVTACSSTDFQGNDFKALVYEFMPNGNLQQWIHTDQHERTLSLLQRVNIAIDVACAIDYLHNSYDVPIIHCDLKPSNILLDSDMVAHIGDFGLARFYLDTTANNSSSVAVKGTTGYVAPEYGLGSMVSKEGDIYSYGIVLIEMMTAKAPTSTMFGGGLDLHNYAKSALSEQLINMIDPRLLDDGACASNENKDQKLVGNYDSSKMMCLKLLIESGVKCSVETPQDRMRIKDAIRELQMTRDMLLTNFVSPVQ
ncbi:putative receptor-like protein kinase At3g47110 [Chenopodium quinoa]|uniref:non-specific serine/threonine protein kinase n=1 Tax=Chenopodium quinoa TaxID=63459 RepID=A0A803KW61_CHEQI|nr:putative receptor-like protein kinase At3g47110 [Chenopodium quinoa]